MVLRILMGIGYRDSCRELLKEQKILTLPSQYIFSLLLFVIRNMRHSVPEAPIPHFMVSAYSSTPVTSKPFGAKSAIVTKNVG
jgi:hypothetical protein